MNDTTRPLHVDAKVSRTEWWHVDVWRQQSNGAPEIPTSNAFALLQSDEVHDGGGEDVQAADETTLDVAIHDHLAARSSVPDTSKHVVVVNNSFAILQSVVELGITPSSHRVAIEEKELVA